MVAIKQSELDTMKSKLAGQQQDLATLRDHLEQTRAAFAAQKAILKAILTELGVLTSRSTTWGAGGGYAQVGHALDASEHPSEWEVALARDDNRTERIVALERQIGAVVSLAKFGYEQAGG